MKPGQLARKYGNQERTVTTITFRGVGQVAATVALAWALAGEAGSHMPPPVKVSNQTLGVAAATIDFCSAIDPPHATSYASRARASLLNVTDADFANARQTSVYLSAYQSIKQVWTSLPAKEAKARCYAGL